MEGNDAAAVARARTGDREAFRELVERHSRHIFRLAYRMTGNEEDAEDVVQETFLRAYRGLPRFEGKASFSTWVHRIAANCAIDLMRRRLPREAPLEIERADAERPPAFVQEPNSLSAPERRFFASDIRRRVAQALGSLSPMERVAFVLRHFEGKPIAEVAQALDVRAGAAKNCVFRAVSKLRRELAAIGPEMP